MLRRHSELPLQGDPSQRHLPWIIAVMVFLAALAVAGVLGLLVTGARCALLGANTPC